MADEAANTDPDIDECVAHLKTLIPAAEHATLDARVQELLSDPSADAEDVILILQDEFDPGSRP